MPNSLIHESSPYLLQHAQNPVNWMPWKNEVLEKAESAGKLLIVSIGYAACHWCHVMEHESFEDEEVAEVMNENFSCIKVDREERPDVDHAYMNAVQIMTGQGGWPMNVVCLPDGTPIWGGTYFKKEQWINALQQLKEMFLDEPEKLKEYASKMKEGLENLDIVTIPQNPDKLDSSWFEIILKKYQRNFDHQYGGFKGAPKFITPSNYRFLLRYSYQTKNKELQEFVIQSLLQFSYGGIYDHVQGGFSRYSVDQKWHIPHFEKMLYDNSQLIILYCGAFQLTGNTWFEEVIKQTLEFIKMELTSPETGFYSSVDADSLDENSSLVEGAFYVWTKQELQEILGEDYSLFSNYYNINSYGKWEDDKYVLIRTKSDTEISSEFNISLENLQVRKQQWLKKLHSIREKRSKPRLDDKQLTSWNAMMLQAYVVAYKTFNIPAYLETAKKSAGFIQNKLIKSDSSMFHSYKNGKATINGYLEDYAAVISAFLEFYSVDLEEEHLSIAENLTEYVLTNFYDDKKGVFYFTSQEDRPLITRNIELTDSVIPSSNSLMAKNLFKLAKYSGHENYVDISSKMLEIVIPKTVDYPQGYSNWLNLALDLNEQFFEVVITGPNCLDNLEKLNALYFPNIVIDGSSQKNMRPLLKDRVKTDKDQIYVCTNGSCQLPVEDIMDAIHLINTF